MIRETSITAYNTIKENGLLSKRRWEVYDALYSLNRPATASEIAVNMPGFKSQSVGANVHARLGELVENCTVAEVGVTKCPITGMHAYLWDVTGRLPVKPNKPTKIKCKSCNGAGYHIQESLL